MRSQYIVNGGFLPEYFRNLSIFNTFRRWNTKAVWNYFSIIVSCFLGTSLIFWLVAVNPSCSLKASPALRNRTFVNFIKAHINDSDFHTISRSSVQIKDSESFKKTRGNGNHSSQYVEYGFNVRISKLVPVNRPLPDIRHPVCKNHSIALETLPSVSIIIPFYNEHYTILYRALHSLKRETPNRLIEEIILVDCYSHYPKIGRTVPQFRRYISKHFPKVKLKFLRITDKMALIKARSMAAKEAIGKVLVFLEPTVEVNKNWLPPLLEFMVPNFRRVVTPILDVIEPNTFWYHSEMFNGNGHRGSFDWSLRYQRLPLLSEDRKAPFKPFRNPILKEPIFAISKKYFLEMGGFDEGLKYWGSDQMEISFKTWMCRGELYTIPCSRVGILTKLPHKRYVKHIQRNYMRVARVWFDDHINFVYKKAPVYRFVEAGAIEHQRAERSKCRSFSWYMKYIGHDFGKYFPIEVTEYYGRGKIFQIQGNGRKLCVGVVRTVSRNNQNLYFTDCRKPAKDLMLSWKFNYKRNILGKGRCWSGHIGFNPSPVVLTRCRSFGEWQKWQYNFDTKQIFIKFRCLDFVRGLNIAILSLCDDNSPSQKWFFEDLNMKRIPR